VPLLIEKMFFCWFVVLPIKNQATPNEQSQSSLSSFSDKQHLTALIAIVCLYISALIEEKIEKQEQRGKYI
jgi:hypothetical protein